MHEYPSVAFFAGFRYLSLQLSSLTLMLAKHVCPCLTLSGRGGRGGAESARNDFNL